MLCRSDYLATLAVYQVIPIKFAWSMDVCHNLIFRAKAYVIRTLLLCDWSVEQTASKPQTQHRKECCSVVSSRFFAGSFAWHPKKRLWRRLIIILTMMRFVMTFDDRLRDGSRKFVVLNFHFYWYCLQRGHSNLEHLTFVCTFFSDPRMRVRPFDKRISCFDTLKMLKIYIMRRAFKS